MCFLILYKIILKWWLKLKMEATNEAKNGRKCIFSRFIMLKNKDFVVYNCL